MEDLTEEELVIQWKNKNFHAATILYERYEKKLLTFLLIETNDYHHAQDLLNEIFICAANGIDRFRGDSAFSTWLYTITRNVLLKHFRKNKRSLRFLSLENFDEKVYYEIEPSIEKYEKLEHCLQYLSSRNCSILLSRFVDGLTLQDIADLHDMSIEGVRKVIKTVLEQLQLCMTRSG